MLRFLLRRATIPTSISISSSIPKPLSPSLPPHLSIPTACYFVVDANRLQKRDSKHRKKARKNTKIVRGKDPSNSQSADDDSPHPPDLPPIEPPPSEYDPIRDVGPSGRPVFTCSRSISLLGNPDLNSYIDFSLDDLNEKLPEGLPPGMATEFDETRRCALLVRQCFLDLRDNFSRLVDPPTYSNSKGPEVRKQIVLDGPVSCGKSIALAMLVHWARSEGWLVFYIPKAKDWTHGDSFYRNPDTNLFDTPFQATKILQDFLKSSEAHLRQLPCQISDPLPLGGEDVATAGKGGLMTLPEAATLFDLVHCGITYKEVSIGVVVRLRQELSLVKDVPVLLAIDQYNSWFTFSEYQERVTALCKRPVHAKYLSTVNAYRSMMHDDMMVGAFSHSTAVGKLRKDLPDVPLNARIFLPRYSLEEAATVCHYYLRQNLIKPESFSEEKCKKIYFLANGNGSEIRSLVPFLE